MKYISGRKEFPFVELEPRLKWFVDIKCGVPFTFWWVNRAATLPRSGCKAVIHAHGGSVR